MIWIRRIARSFSFAHFLFLYGLVLKNDVYKTLEQRQNMLENRSENNKLDITTLNCEYE